MTGGKRIYLGAVALGLVAGSILSYRAYDRHLDARVPKKPNILVLSLCSLRKNELKLFNPAAPAVTPRLDQAFANSFVLENVYSSFGWTNLSLYFMDKFEGDFLTANGYEIIEDDWRPSSVHVPGRLDAQSYEGPPEQFVNFTRPKLEFVKKRVLEFRKNPFFAYIHIKYMHFPYVDQLNPEPGWDRFLSAAEKARVEALMREPGRWRDNLPFAMKLTGDPRLLESVPEYKTAEVDPFKAFFGMYNLLIDARFLASWVKQPDYESDLELLRKVYRAKLAKLDDMLAEMLDLYGRKDLRDETLVVLMGDHGEAFMEHGLLGHGHHVFDEILTLPVLVRFPRSNLWGRERISGQIYMGSLSDWLSQLVSSGQREHQFAADLKANPRNRFIVSRNCPNNIHSVRFDGRWKFIHDRIQREKYLFDLKHDPGEKTNVINQHPNIAADLEIHLTTHLQDLDQITDPTPCKGL